jgi:hypothetical protein
MSLRTRAFLTACLLSLAGCGNSHTADDDDPPIELPDGSTSGRDAGGGGVDAGGGPVDAGGTVVDSGVVVVDASGPMADGGTTAEPDAGPGTIDCMGMSCDAATEECCVVASGGGASASCIPAGSMCEGTAVDCDGPDDCDAGEICCARGGGGGGGFTVGCEPAGGDCGSGFSSFELCATADDCSDPADTMCCPVAAGGFSASYCADMCFGFP